MSFNNIVIDGQVKIDHRLDGDCDLLNIIDGETGVVTYVSGTLHPTYTGAYTVTPTQSTQTLLTDDMLMTNNVTINPIPSNYGLITWNGSVLTVS